MEIELGMSSCPDVLFRGGATHAEGRTGRSFRGNFLHPRIGGGHLSPPPTLFENANHWVRDFTPHGENPSGSTKTKTKKEKI